MLQFCEQTAETVSTDSYIYVDSFAQRHYHNRDLDNHLGSAMNRTVSRPDKYVINLLAKFRGISVKLFYKRILTIAGPIFKLIFINFSRQIIEFVDVKPSRDREEHLDVKE
jgi:hypothetical protein